MVFWALPVAQVDGIVVVVPSDAGIVRTPSSEPQTAGKAARGGSRLWSYSWRHSHAVYRGRSGLN
jgi:hypothetical protein